MPDVVIIDTDVLIDAGRGVHEALECLDQIERQAVPAVADITRMELIVGCRNKSELRALDHFLARFQVLKLNEQISDTAVDLLQL